MQRTNFNRSQIFGYKNGIPVVVESKPAQPLAGLTTQPPPAAEGAPASEDPAFRPAWVVLDRKVLRCAHPATRPPAHRRTAVGIRARRA